MTGPDTPTEAVDTEAMFGFGTTLDVRRYAEPTEHVPAIDDAYRFDPDVTLAILSGFTHNRRVLVQGAHGTGKSTHIEQIAARLNWPCVRINLDGHLTRLDLIGRDAIVVRDGQQVTEFQEGMLPWAVQRPVALVFDEYDAGRPDVLFVLQRVLESDGHFTLLDQNRVLVPHPGFRLFATANTVGLGDLTGLYRGTQQLNQAQLDRWSMVATLDYLDPAVEADIVARRVPALAAGGGGPELIDSMVAMAALTRVGFAAGDLSTVMSPRTVISWAENQLIVDEIDRSFRLTFANRCDLAERPILAEYFQRVFGRDIVGLDGAPVSGDGADEPDPS